MSGQAPTLLFQRIKLFGSPAIASKTAFFILLLTVLTPLAPVVPQAFADSRIRTEVANEVSRFQLLPEYPQISDTESSPYLDYFRNNCHDSIDLLPEDVRTVVEDINTRMQLKNFGRILFKLMLGPADIMTTDAQEKTIYIDSRFIIPLVRSLEGEKRDASVAVLLGHEMGHYLYDAIVLAAPTATTDVGNVSISKSHNLELAHGEVDAIGFNLAERAGYKVDLAKDIFTEVNAALKIGDAVVKSTSISPERQSMIDAYLSDK